MAQNSFQDFPRRRFFMGHYHHSLSVDATIMVSKNYPIIGEHVGIILVTLQVTIATLWPAKNILNFSFKVDGTSFPDAGSLVTTAHVTHEICPRDLKYRKSKTDMAAQKLLHTRWFFSCLSEIRSKRKLSFGHQLLSNSVCVRKTLFVTQCPKFKAKVSSVWRSILSAIVISNNLKTTGFHHTDRPLAGK